MEAFLVTVHVTAGAIVVGVLFVQSLAVVMAMRLPGEAQREGVRTLQGRIHAFIYYPILAVAVAVGFWLAFAGDVFAQGRWLHWKLVFVVLLVGLGQDIGRQEATPPGLQQPVAHRAGAGRRPAYRPA